MIIRPDYFCLGTRRMRIRLNQDSKAELMCSTQNRSQNGLLFSCTICSNRTNGTGAAVFFEIANSYRSIKEGKCYSVFGESHNSSFFVSILRIRKSGEVVKLKANCSENYSG